MKYLKRYETFYNENYGNEEIDADALSTELVDNDEKTEGCECGCDDECECNKDKEEEKIEEKGEIRKYFTGHDSPESRDKAMMSFHKALDDAEADVKKNPNGYVFNREALEAKAKDNNYRGGLRIQRGGRDKKRIYIVYDEGATGFQRLAGGAGGARREILGM